jgi:hypothetical protein
MIKPTALISLIAALVIANHAAAASLTFSSQEQRTALIELYTSEGCSSCPPADRWLSRLKDDPRLWKQIVPVAFHVDYWNYLGWRDRFADARFSKRQGEYQQHHYLQTVYTPGVMKNGREWRGWSYGDIPLFSHVDQAGILKITIGDENAGAEFLPAHRGLSRLTLNLALLGSDLSTRVATGENAGKILRHDFVVLDFQQFTQAGQDGQFHWKLPGLLKRPRQEKSAIALWVTAVGDPTPLQAAGGWLK